MAIRLTTHILKNSDIVSRPLPSSLYGGEPIINTADGIMYLSGSSTTTDEWTPAGTGTTGNFFEVGSNLYDLKLRNQITQYQGISGASLSGKFLSGTTTGFVLADISTITTDTNDYTTGSTLIGTTAYFDRTDSLSAFTLDLSTLDINDTFVTGATFTNNLLTLTDNDANTVTAVIDNFTGLTVNGTISATTIDSNSILSGGTNINTLFQPLGDDNFTTGTTLIGTTLYFDRNDTLSAYTADLSSFIDDTNTFTTGGTIIGSSLYLDRTDTLSAVTIDVSSLLDNTDNVTTGSTLIGSTAYFDRTDGLSAFTLDLSTFVPTGDTFVTGGTVSYTDEAGTLILTNNDGDVFNVTGFTDIQTTGGTLAGSSITFTQNDATTFAVDLSALEVNDTFVTGFTYDDANTLTIARNEGESALTVDISTVTGLTVSTLGSNRVVYTTSSGVLTTEAGFTYDQSTDLLTVGDLAVTNASGNTATIGQGGLVVGSGGSISTPGIGDLIVHGDFTVFGDTTTVATTELYIEDPQITLNYNPTGTTSVTSIASGLRIQDGDGAGNDVLYTVAQMDTFTGGAVTEYGASTGYTNRAFLTQLNDIVIRNTNSNNGAPDGSRVLAENDVLDGGVY